MFERAWKPLKSYYEEKVAKLAKHYEDGGVAQAGDAILRFAGRNAHSYTIQPICRALYKPPSIYIHNKLSTRLNVFNERWDLLIVLDTARPDALEIVEDEFDFITSVGSRWSVGGSSPEWMLNTFHTDFKDEISKTAYISSNPYTSVVFDQRLERPPHKPQFPRLQRYGNKDFVFPEDFFRLVDLHNTSMDSVGYNFPSPREVTDAVISIDRDESPERVVAHYMPPHSPYVTKHNNGELEFVDRRPDTSFEAYLDNLRWGLGEVETLINNVDRDRVVITADHGENFHWRKLRRNHHPGMFAPSVRRVPWVVTTAEDRVTHAPKTDSVEENTNTEDVLETLGYLD